MLTELEPLLVALSFVVHYFWPPVPVGGAIFSIEEVEKSHQVNEKFCRSVSLNKRTTYPAQYVLHEERYKGKLKERQVDGPTIVIEPIDAVRNLESDYDKLDQAERDGADEDGRAVCFRRLFENGTTKKERESLARQFH